MEEMMLVKLIDEHLKKKPRDPRARQCFHPSSAHKSAKELYRMYFNGDSFNVSPRLQRIFDNGHYVHERLQRYLEECGILFQVEVPLENKEYQIRGTCDAIIRIGDKDGIVEIKSCNQNVFYSLHEPKAEHVVQLHLYMFMSGIPRGVLLYECKNDQELKNFFVKQDPEVLEPVLEKIKYVQECVEKGIEP